MSLHCWQGDDVAGFETRMPSPPAGGGIQATGNYPGRARDIGELQADLEQVAALIPGKLRLNLHAIYADFQGRKVERDALTLDYFKGWIDWAENAPGASTSIPPASPTLLQPMDLRFRIGTGHPAQFWIDHCIASRHIGAAIGQALGTPAVTNIWIPDGYKDIPADRLAPRERLLESLDAIFAAQVDGQWNIDALESKLFGIGFESYTVGSHEFYLGYAARKGIALCLDAGHFHPTESVGDKISSSCSSCRACSST